MPRSSSKKVAENMLESFGNNKMVTCLLLAVILILLVYIVMSGREMFFSGDAIESTPGDKLVMFYADWCPHCQAIKPDVEELQQELQNDKVNGKKVTIVLVDCVKEEDMASKYEVEGFPTLILFKANGDKKDFDGDRSKEGIKSFLEDNV